ncbi:ImmA/IrrE family metallo-endopeptidase [Actinomyces bowdenii]|uniref:ImmA/IrrE family metallo-endopeptidase n=1 Tax=Actinomyces bowdenii TaxID=131109 RepID=A0A3P1UTM0_9ACTO|nr:ImmA/IrrE family metallo-endopeptidase [Actinomyces bowdenii]RRD24455.1 ImmA/IrrE family metallo-endopeptidase [Actinomyces bowdenii]
MSTRDQFAREADAERIAHQLVVECTQVSIPALREDPIGVLDRYAGINVVYSSRQAEAGCGKGGGYYRADPPTIYLHPSSSRRDAFTVLHEFAHHLQRHHPEWGFSLMDIRDSRQRMRVEETVCDRFAAEILLPPNQTDEETLVSHPADVMAQLFANSQSSRSAVVQAVAGRMPAYAKWILCVIDPKGVVTTSQSTYSDYSPGKKQIHTPLAQLALEAQAGPVRRHLDEAYTFSTGATMTGMWAEACRDHEGRYTFVALRPQRRYGVGQILEERFVCANPSCSVERDSTRNLRRCGKCGQPYCPDCVTCSCDPASTGKQCPECFTELTPHEVRHGHECA